MAGPQEVRDRDWRDAATAKEAGSHQKPAETRNEPPTPTPQRLQREHSPRFQPGLQDCVRIHFWVFVSPPICDHLVQPPQKRNMSHGIFNGECDHLPPLGSSEDEEDDSAGFLP